MKIRIRLNYVIILILIFIVTKASAASAPTGGEVEGSFSASDGIALVLYMLLAILFSFLCSIAEAVLLNITPSYIAELQDRNPNFASKVKKIRQTNVDQSLAAILTMNTIAHTVGAIGSGAEATAFFGSKWFGLFSAIMTLLILFASEIIPKTIGVVYWRKLVKSVILYIQTLSFVLYPLIWISEFITRLITKNKEVHVFNRDEFVAMAGVGAVSGAINLQESKIIQNLFKLDSLIVNNIFTPRTVIVGIDQKSTVSEVFSKHSTTPFSRLLIYDGNMDNVAGFVLREEILLFEAQGKGETIINELKRNIIAVQTTMPISKLLEKLIDEKQQIALVVDDYGTKGLVTLEDVLETLLGLEIVDENDTVEDMQNLAREVWEKRMKRLGVDITKYNEEKSE